MIEENEKGQSVVVIDTILFNGKRSIDWHSVEEYARRYKGVEVHCKEDIIVKMQRMVGEDILVDLHCLYTLNKVKLRDIIILE